MTKLLLKTIAIFICLLLFCYLMVSLPEKYAWYFLGGLLLLWFSFLFALAIDNYND